MQLLFLKHPSEQVKRTLDLKGRSRKVYLRMKFFSEIIGHQKIVSLLRKSIAAGRVAHAYLFLGPAGIGKTTVVRAFSRALLCPRPRDGDACGTCRDCRQAAEGNHPDFLLVKPAPGTIKIDQVREVQRRVALTPYQGRRQVCLIEQAETMTVEAANCFLKTLEEPPAGSVFILVSEQPYALLPTVVSRCQQVFFHLLATAEVMEGLFRLAGLDRGRAELPAILSGGSLGRALALAAEGNLAGPREKVFTTAAALARVSCAQACRLAQDFAGEREELQIFLETFLLWYRDLLIWRLTGDEKMIVNRDFLPLFREEAKNYTVSRILGIIEKVEQAQKHLRANANPRLAAEVLFMQLGRREENALPGCRRKI